MYANCWQARALVSLSLSLSLSLYIYIYIYIYTSTFILPICFEAELICMQPTWSGNTTGEAQAGLDLTVPQRQWQVNRHSTGVYTVIYSSLPQVKEHANSAFSLEGCLLLSSVFCPKTVKPKQDRETAEGKKGIRIGVASSCTEARVMHTLKNTKDKCASKCTQHISHIIYYMVLTGQLWHSEVLFLSSRPLIWIKVCCYGPVSDHWLWRSNKFILKSIKLILKGQFTLKSEMHIFSIYLVVLLVHLKRSAFS